jgi:DNA-binding response OmpR family regulator
MASVVRTLKKVLIVDDNPAIGSEIHQEFNRHGFLCSNAENRRQAIEQVVEILPDLIILDLSMPVMNGLDAAPELNKSFRIVLSFFISFLRIPWFSRRMSKLAV